MIRRLRGAKQANEGSLEFRIGFERCALEFFETQATSADAETASAAAALAAECRAALEVLGLREDAGEADVPAVTAAAAGRAKTEVAEVEAEALRLELDEIQRLREEVYLLQMTTSG